MVDKENTVYFYDYETELTKKEDLCLNNFAISEFTGLDDFKYLTAEHYYQCHKFDDFNAHENFKKAFQEIRSAPDPLQCKKLARNYQKEFENVWNKTYWDNEYKDYIMKRALCLKFSQNKEILHRLVETGNKRLVEESYKDPYWGGMLPESRNRLGNLLMELRDNYIKTGKIFLEGSNLDPLIV